MSNASQAINSLDQTINSFKSRVDVKVNDVNTSTANIQATTNRIYENVTAWLVCIAVSNPWVECLVATAVFGAVYLGINALLGSKIQDEALHFIFKKK